MIEMEQEIVQQYVQHSKWFVFVQKNRSFQIIETLFFFSCDVHMKNGQATKFLTYF